MPDKLQCLFAKVLKMDVNIINDETSPHNTPQWDSLSTMLLVAELEDCFDVSFSTEEIMAIKSVAIVREILQKRGVSNA